MKALIEEYGIFILEALGCLATITLLYQVIFNSSSVASFVQAMLISLVG